MILHRDRRTAISPIIATVLIIAVTLIAAVAIGGFVFGIFGSSASTANISVTGTTLTTAGFGTGTSGDITCVTSNPSAPYLTLTNSGTASAALMSITVTWGGSSNTFVLHSGTTCAVGSAGAGSATTYAEFTSSPEVTASITTGAQYSGTVAMSNGASVLFTGTWQ